MEIIALTSKAQSQARLMQNREETPKEGLRVAVIGGGCSGLQYKLGFDNPKENDIAFTYENGLQVLVDEKSALHLSGCSLEYHDEISRSGFEVINPGASTTCGCGKSFQ